MGDVLTVSGYTHHPGHHCESTAARNVFAHARVDLNEEMLFGLGEGLGFIYWFMKGKKVAMPFPFVGFRNGRAVELISRAAKRLGITGKAVETNSVDQAHKNVRSVLASGQPVCIYVDMVYLPYMRLPEEAHFGGHSIVLYELDDDADTARVSDTLDEPQTITLAEPMEARRMHVYGETEEDLAQVSALCHNNSLENPYAQWPAQHGFSKITVEDVYKSRLISWPYRLLECAMTSEGASALLLANEEFTKKLTDNPVWITGVGFGSDTMRAGDRPDNPAWKGLYPEDEKIWPKHVPAPMSPYPDFCNFGSLRVSARMAYKDAGIKNPRKEMSLVEIFDPYAGVVLAGLEDFDFCKRGEGKKLLRDGVIQPHGELPCQLSGALTAQGHAVGSTSIAQVVDVYWQLSNQIGKKWGAPGRQLSNPKKGFIHGHGGTGCQAGAVVLEV